MQGIQPPGKPVTVSAPPRVMHGYTSDSNRCLTGQSQGCIKAQEHVIQLHVSTGERVTWARRVGRIQVLGIAFITATDGRLTILIID
jgi:hypothetical protein